MEISRLVNDVLMWLKLQSHIQIQSTLTKYTYKVHLQSTLTKNTYKVHLQSTLTKYTYKVHLQSTLTKYTYKVHLQRESGIMDEYQTSSESTIVSREVTTLIFSRIVLPR